MKTIGLLGGMSWESSLLYYQIINQETNRLLGGQNSAKLILYSVNFEQIEKLQHQNKWDEAAMILIEASLSLQKAGADFIVICTNTMHKLLPQIASHVNIPFLHIAKATASKIVEHGIKKVLLLGTKFTMEEDFYKQKLIDSGLQVVIPNQLQREKIHNIIYHELCLGEIKESSKEYYLEVIDSFDDISGVILGCTEIGMLIKAEDTNLKVFDTTTIHAKAAVAQALAH
jgi:aspartate racemase